MPPTNRSKTGKFEKGKSGNPSGRPKENPEVKAIFKARSAEAALKVVELMNCGIEKIELAAAQEILNRTEGKPIQPQNIEVSGGLDMRAQIRAVLLERLNGKSDGNTEDRTHADS